MGFRGSFVSDLFFQSIGLISILISITYFITGINIIRTKKLLIILHNSFYLILYSLLASLFCTIYYFESFWLTINGNGGFIGKLLSETFLTSLVNLNKQISYYFLLISIGVLFLISINLNISWFSNLIKKIILKLISKKDKILNYNEKVIDEIQNLKPTNIKSVQEDLPFVNTENEKKIIKAKFKLPLT